MPLFMKKKSFSNKKKSKDKTKKICYQTGGIDQSLYNKYKSLDSLYKKIFTFKTPSIYYISPLSDLYNLYKKDFLNYYKKDKRIEKDTPYIWLMYDVLNIPYKLLNDHKLLNIESNDNHNLYIQINNYQFTLLYKLFLDDKDLTKIIPFDHHIASFLYNTQLLFVRSKNMDNNDERILILYNSNSQLFTWRFLCFGMPEYNKTYKLEKPGHYVTGTFVHIELQKFINYNYKQIPIATNLDELSELHRVHNINLVVYKNNRNEKDLIDSFKYIVNNQIEYSKDIIKNLTQCMNFKSIEDKHYDFSCGELNTNIQNSFSNLLVNDESKMLWNRNLEEIKKYENQNELLEDYLLLVKLHFETHYKINSEPQLQYTYNLSDFDYLRNCLDNNNSLLENIIGLSNISLSRRFKNIKVYKILIELKDKEEYINKLEFEIQKCDVESEIDKYSEKLYAKKKQFLTKLKNDIYKNINYEFEYYFINYDFLSNTKIPEKYVNNIPSNLNKFNYKWNNYNSPYFIIPVNIPITSNGLYSCYVSAGLYFCKVVEYTNQLTNLITDENKIKSFIIDHTYSFLGDFYNNKIPFINR